MASEEDKLRHLEWALKSRAENQACSLRLLKLFSDYPDVWKTKKFARAAQDLVAVAFSLWRAAFLADKSGRRSEVFVHGKSFLEKLIEDNSIAYVQDKTAREWTFNYYTRNARSSLQVLATYWPESVPAYEGKKRGPAERWEYCQKLFAEAVAGFEKRLSTRKKKTVRLASPQTPKPLSARQKRAKVRELTLAEREDASK
jgi:hypothetical protein